MKQQVLLIEEDEDKLAGCLPSSDLKSIITGK